MKRYVVIKKDGDGNLKEEVHFLESKPKVEDIPGFIVANKGTRVKHPSPAVLVKVVSTIIGFDLAQFYTECERIADIGENKGVTPPSPENAINGKLAPKTNKP